MVGVIFRSSLLVTVLFSVAWSKKYEDVYKESMDKLKTSGKKMSWTVIKIAWLYFSMNFQFHLYKRLRIYQYLDIPN